MKVEGVVGPQSLQDGAQAQPRLGKTAEQVVQTLHGALYEVVKRGSVFIASTGVAGVAPGTALSTTPPFTLYNPVNSGVDLVVLLATLGYISGTLGAGTVFLGVNSNANQAAPSGGTSIVPLSARTLGSGGGQGQVFQGATLAAAPSVLRPLFNLTALLASTAVQPYAVTEDLRGSIIIPQGAALSMQAVAAAGTSPLVVLGMQWEEVPA